MVRFSEPSGAGLYFTGAWLDFAGRQADEERGFGWTERIHPEDRERVLAVIGRAALDGGPVELEYRLRQHDGEYRQVIERVEPQGPAGCLSTVTAVTDRVERMGAGGWSAEPGLPEQYPAILDSIDQGFCVVEVTFDEQERPLDYRFLGTNRVFEGQTGLSDPIGRSARELVPDLDDFWFETYGRVALTGEPMRFENHAPAMGRWFDVYAFRVGRAESRQVAILFKDVTRRKESEQGLQEANERVRSILESISGQFFAIDSEWRYTFFNQQAKDQLVRLGEDPEQLLGRTLWEAFPEVPYADDFRRAMRERVPARHEFYHPPLEQWVQNRIFPTPDGGLAVFQEYITERKQAEDLLRHRGEQFETLLNEAPLGVYLVDADFRLAEVNPVARPAFGDLPGLIGRDFEEVLRILWPKEYVEQVVRDFRHTLETGEPHETLELAQYREDRGVVEYYEWRINRITLPDGRYGVVCYFRDISDQVSARRTIAESEARYRALFESIDEGFCVVEVLLDEAGVPVDYRWLEINRLFEEQTGLKDPIGRTARELVPDLDAFWFETYGRVALTGEPMRFENHAPAMGRWFDVYTFRLGRPENRHVAILFKDITERKRREEALRESEARFRAMADGLPLMVWVHDEAGKQEFVNRAFCEFFGITIEESRGDGWQILMHPDDAEAYTAEFLACVDAQRPFNAEVRVRDRDGRWRWLASWGQPRFSPSGDFRGFVGTSADVTHQKEIEESLRTQRRELEAALELNRMITDNAHSCLIMLDPEGRATYMNPAAEQVTGFTVDEVREETLHDKIHHHRRDGAEQPADDCALYRAYQAMEDIRHFEDEFIRKDGTFFPVTGSVASITRYGVHEGSLLEFRDVSEIRETEEALQQSESRFRLVTNVIPQLVWISEPSGEVSYFNDGWYDFTGQTGEEALGWGWTGAVHPEDRQRVETAWRNAVDHQERYEVEYRIRRRDGQYCWHIGRGMPLVDREGRVWTWFGTYTDIDQMKQTEDQLRRANAIKDEFLSLVSHELRTPLTTIVGLTRVLGRGAADLSDEDRDTIAIIARDSERLQTLIENLLILARVEENDVELEPLRLPRLVERVVAMHAQQHPDREIEMEMADDLPIVEGQGVWVEQVLANGLSNAEKYSPEDKPITVRAYPEAERVVVQVIDRGPGMEGDDLERIFEPFFRSSRAMSLAIPGAGLGMSISRRLIELQGGSIRADQADTGGLLFEFSLPVLIEQ